MSEQENKTNPETTPDTSQEEDNKIPVGYRPLAAALVATDVFNDTLSVAESTVDMATGNVKRGGSNLLKSIGSLISAPVNMASRLFVGKDAINISPSFKENPDGSLEGAPITNTLSKTVDVADHLTAAAFETATSPLQLFEGTEAFTNQLSSAGNHVVSAGQSLIGKHAKAQNITNKKDEQNTLVNNRQNEYE